MKPGRALTIIIIFLAALAIVPASKSASLKSTVNSFFQKPLSLSRNISQLFSELWLFRRNAKELRELKYESGENKSTADEIKTQELLLENQRLTKMLELNNVLQNEGEKTVFARVIARSPSAWNRVFLIDKGSQHGIKVNTAVFSNSSLVGKILEVGASASKVLLITDPNSRIGGLIQRTRDQGIVYGAFTGECRMKYLSVDADIVPGDIVESAGYGGFFPKAAPIGKVAKVWKEPGQIYKVAEITPLTDLNRIEEVACLE